MEQQIIQDLITLLAGQGLSRDETTLAWALNKAAEAHWSKLFSLLDDTQGIGPAATESYTAGQQAMAFFRYPDLPVDARGVAAIPEEYSTAILRRVLPTYTDGEHEAVALADNSIANKVRSTLVGPTSTNPVFEYYGPSALRIYPVPVSVQAKMAVQPTECVVTLDEDRLTCTGATPTGFSPLSRHALFMLAARNLGINAQDLGISQPYAGLAATES